LATLAGGGSSAGTVAASATLARSRNLLLETRPDAERAAAAVVTTWLQSLADAGVLRPDAVRVLVALAGVPAGVGPGMQLLNRLRAQQPVRTPGAAAAAVASEDVHPQSAPPPTGDQLTALTRAHELVAGKLVPLARKLLGATLAATRYGHPGAFSSSPSAGYTLEFTYKPDSDGGDASAAAAATLKGTTLCPPTTAATSYSAATRCCGARRCRR
jgi:hypothetical protein